MLYTAITTPFIGDSIDITTLYNHIMSLLQQNSGIVLFGTTGECPTITDDEKFYVMDLLAEKLTDEQKSRFIIGVGGNNTSDCVTLATNSAHRGFKKIMITAPYYNKPTQEGIYQHFKFLAEASKLPIILYNVPGRTGSNMLADTTLRLAELTNIVAVKEASGNFEQIMDIINRKPKGFNVLSGDDAITMPLIACGAAGVISVVANALPEKFSTMVNASLKGEFDLARPVHNELLNITKMFFEEGNPGGVKVALENREIMQQNLRLPLVPVSSSLANRINQEMKSLVQLAHNL